MGSLIAHRVGAPANTAGVATECGRADAHPSSLTARVSSDESKVRNVSRHYGSRSDECVGADSEAREDDGATAERRVMVDACCRIHGDVTSGARARVVRKRHTGPHEYAVSDDDAIPDGDATFDGNVIAEDGPAFDEDMVADLTVAADRRSWQEIAECPYS